MPGSQHPHLQNHYQVLGLSCSTLSEPAPSHTTQDIRRAYKRALLQHHPDKLDGRSAQHHGLQCRQQYSVDEITLAFKTLSAPALRGEYDRELLLRRRTGRASYCEEVRDVDWVSGSRQAARGQDAMWGRMGMEVVDLDDLAYDEHEGVWYRGCRCGLLRGFEMEQKDLEGEIEEQGGGASGELLVGCWGCSLWVAVRFGVLGDEDEGLADEGGRDAVLAETSFMP